MWKQTGFVQIWPWLVYSSLSYLPAVVSTSLSAGLSSFHHQSVSSYQILHLFLHHATHPRLPSSLSSPQALRMFVTIGETQHSPQASTRHQCNCGEGGKKIICSAKPIQRWSGTHRAAHTCKSECKSVPHTTVSHNNNNISGKYGKR